MYAWGALGEDVLIKRNVTIPFIQNVRIGSHVRIDDNVIIIASNPDEPVIIEDHVHIAVGCYLAGSDGITLSFGSGLSPYCQLFSGSDDYTGQKLTNPTWPKELIGGPHGRITLGEHVILGAGTVVHPNVTIGEGSAVGSLSLVTKSLGTWGIYAGIPARRLRDRSKALLDLVPPEYRK